MKTKGFTLVELLVVIAILAILATVSVVGYTSFIAGADEQAAISEAEQAKTIINAGLTLDDYVKVSANQWVKYDAATKAYSIVTSDPETASVTVHDATADWTLTGTLSVGSDNGLYYTATNGKIVKLADLKIVTAVPTTTPTT